MSTDADLDVDHLADLANLPLQDEDRQRLAEACAEVLEAFELPPVDGDEPRQAVDPGLEDAPEPWPEDEREAILDQAPARDGRHIQT